MAWFSPDMIAQQPGARPSRPIGASMGRPVRATLINEDVGPNDGGPPRHLEVFFNPDSLKINRPCEWAKIAVPGLSHEVLQWSHTASAQISFTLQWSLLEAQRRQGRPNAQDPPDAVSRAQLHNYPIFLRAMLLPLGRGRAPSRVTLAWPRVCNITGAVTGVDFTIDRFARDGSAMSFSADVSMIELRTTFLERPAVSDPTPMSEAETAAAYEHLAARAALWSGNQGNGEW